MTEKKRHILFLPAWYPDRNDPMNGLFVQNHAKSVNKFQQVTVVFAQKDNNVNGKYDITCIEENGFPEIIVYYKPVKCKISVINSIMKALRLRNAIYKGIVFLELEYGKPDLIHAHILTRYGVLAYWLSKRWHIPYLITEHWSRYIPQRNEFKGFIRKWATRFVVKRAKAILPVTKNLSDSMQMHHLENTNYQIVNNVVDTDLFKPSIEENDISVFRFVHISCMDNRSKNVTGILDAVKILSQKRENFHLSVIGDGVDFELIKNYARDNELKNEVSFSGLLVGKDLINEINKNQCLVLFSNFENIPVVINECMACGIPVISSDVGGISEHVTHDKGMMVKRGDVYGLANAMEKMMEHYKQYDAQKLRQYALNNFSSDSVGRKLSNIYEEILSNV